MHTLRRVATLIADSEFWLLWVYGAPLLISSSIPLWLLLGALCSVPLFWLARRGARGAWTVATPLDLPLALWGALGIVAVAVSITPVASLGLYVELLGGMALYYGIVNGATPRHIAPGIVLLMLLGLGMGALGWSGLRYSDKFGLALWLQNVMPKIDWTIFNPRGFTPNIVAGAVAPIVPVAIAFAFTKTGWRRVGALALAIFLLATVALTQSRGAALGLGVAFGMLALWRFPRAVWLLPLVVVLLGGVVLAVGPTRVVDFMVLSDSTGSAAGRLELWQRAVYIFQDFPFTGIGLGTFQQVVPVMYPLFINDLAAPLPHAHNMYLQMGVDYGIGGLVAFVGLTTTALLTGWTALRGWRGTPNGALALGLFAGYAVYLVHGLLDAVFVSAKVSVVIWMTLALLTALYRSAPCVARHE